MIDSFVRKVHLDRGIRQFDAIYQPSTFQRSSISKFWSVFKVVLVVVVVPVRVVGIIPALVVEMVPDLVVEMVPAIDGAETASINVIVHEIDVSFFIVLLLVTQNIRGIWSAWRLA